MFSFSLERFLKEQTGDDGSNFSVLDFKELEQTDSLAERSDLEWLSTNGLGSYASQSIAQANTRRYHGLFVAALEPPVRRHVLLARLDEVVETADGTRIDLSTAYWQGGAVSPHGYERLRAFSNLPVPTWLYELPGGVLIKQITMVYGEQRVVIGYSWLPDEGTATNLVLKTAVLANFRDFHSETHGDSNWRFQQEFHDGRVSIKAFDDATEWHLNYSSGRYVEDPDWYWGYSWSGEWERGLADSEDLYRTGFLETTLSEGKTYTITAALEPADKQYDANEVVRSEWSRLQELVATARVDGKIAAQLLIAGDQFVVERRSTGSASVVAGYHWFGDWGRDTMISLPGLLIETGRHSVARSVLSTFGKYMSEGMLPNYFPDSGQDPVYNSLDATLWWAVALDEYYRNTGDVPFLLEQVPLLDKVVIAHLQGTRHGIKVDPVDGLITGGEPSIQLTWMDAKCEDMVVTPRHGKAVEINALWFNFLKTLELLHTTLGSAVLGSEGAEYDLHMGLATRYADMAEKARLGFKAFWNDDAGCLFDVIGKDGYVDPSIRPNQIFAVSLPFKVISPEQAAGILSVVEKDLLTDFGLRTLAPRDPAYKGTYGDTMGAADQYHRDLTYHQGTAWPFLIGHWVDARVAVHGLQQSNFELIAERLLPLIQHMNEEACIGSISEIFDGDEPHRPMGCVAQAWSVAEMTRVVLKYPQLREILETTVSPPAVSV
ncbi:MAG: hypothetical protein C0469_14545 [Cyanobacteria bacterium DS2.3.42]|nr:hypothetical protein [Cyanobacteria bacterium DS2.3.42]